MGRADGSMGGLASPWFRGSIPCPFRALCHSVKGMFFLRDLVSARTWLAMTHYLVGLAVGLTSFFLMIPLLMVGVVTLPLAFVGVPVIGLAMRVSNWCAAFERARFRFFLGAEIPAWPASSRAGYRWLLVPRWRAFRERATWGELCYAMFHLAWALAWFVLSFTIWAAALILVTLPFYAAQLPNGGVTIFGRLIHGPGILALSAVGVVLLLAAPQVT